MTSNQQHIYNLNKLTTDHDKEEYCILHAIVATTDARWDTIVSVRPITKDEIMECEL